MSFKILVMKIPSVNIYPLNNKKYSNNINKNYNYSTSNPLQYDTFATKNVKDSQVHFGMKFNKNFFMDFFRVNPINSFENFTKEEYLELTSAQLARLRLQVKHMETTKMKGPFVVARIQDLDIPVEVSEGISALQNIGEIHAYVATGFKNIFDERFGEGKYVILPIGRSLSTFAKSMAVKIGEENVVDIPLSDARRFYSPIKSPEKYGSFYNKLKKDKGLKTFKEFLSSKNLSKEDIENSGKTYILMDYCDTGHSLRGAEQLLKSDLIWGNKKHNIIVVDFLKLISNFSKRAMKKQLPEISSDNDIVPLIRDFLTFSEYKSYSTVGSSPNLEDTIKAANYIESGLVTKDMKLVWFDLIDKVMTKSDSYDVKISTNRKVFNNVNVFNPIAPKQKVELWEDNISSYEKDLRNDINEFNKILIKKDLLEADFIDIDKELLKEIAELSEYNDILMKSYSDLYDKTRRYKYYEIKANIEKMLSNVSSKLDNVEF